MMARPVKVRRPTYLTLTCACAERCGREAYVGVFPSEGGQGAKGTATLAFSGLPSKATFILDHKGIKQLHMALGAKA